MRSSAVELDQRARGVTGRVNMYEALRQSNHVGAEIPGRFRVEFVYHDRGVAVYRYTNLSTGYTVTGMLHQCEYEVVREGGDPFSKQWRAI